MPSVQHSLYPEYSSVNYRLASLAQNSPPPPQICAEINERIRSNPALACATFDFSAHVQTRSYIMRNIIVGDTKCATFLDSGVQNLLPMEFEQPHPSPPDTFEIVKTQKKGLGMFACQDIPAGAMILGERPVVIVPYLVGLPMPLSDIFLKLFNQLSPVTFHHLMSLNNSNGENDSDYLEGIVRTNSIGIKLDVPDVPHPELSTHRAIFLNTSRCNHSCGPNAKWEWDVTSFSLYLTAVRPIVSGEEITIHYTSITRPQYERQNYLRSSYGFSCRCEYCLLPSTEAVLQSDEARAELETFWADLPTFEHWCLDASLPDAALIDRHVRALQLIEQEGLHILNPDKHVDGIAMCYGALENVEMFRAWTGRAREVKSRSSYSQTVVFAKWLSNPMAFPAWGWRKTFCGSRAVG